MPLSWMRRGAGSPPGRRGALRAPFGAETASSRGDVQAFDCEPMSASDLWTSMADRLAARPNITIVTAQQSAGTIMSGVRGESRPSFLVTLFYTDPPALTKVEVW